MDWQNSVVKLIQENQSNLFKIETIKLWLKSYQQIYEELYKTEKAKYWYQSPQGDLVRLPPKTKQNKMTKFLRVYEALKEISEFHKKEKYFQKELLSYYEIKDSNSSLNKWISSNENIGSEKYSTFLLDYLDYDDDIKHLKIFIPGFDEVEIYIHRNDFRYTIEFISVFNHIYW